MFQSSKDRKAFAFPVALLCLLLFNFFPGLVNECQAQTNLPKVLPPSPETSALFKALDYPVDYSRGVTDINIPIYEIKSGSLSVL